MDPAMSNQESTSERQDTGSPPPVVFLSYSHDSKEHKQWVAALAQKLVQNGVQVLFDQWDLDPGDDVPKFMERAVSKADRVLMVCTSAYVRKADDGQGGVGYEAMVVTGELVTNLGTKKFIPIVRQTGQEKLRPRCVSTRLFIDLSEETTFDEGFEGLLRELHNIRTIAKPPLGPNPFAGESFAGPMLLAQQAAREAQFGDVLDDAGRTYEVAVEIIRKRDKLGWRRLLKAASSHSLKRLHSWKSDGSLVPQSTEEDRTKLFAHAESGLSCYSPLIACVLAASESSEEGFSGQLGWVDEILSPGDWSRSGSIYWVDFPDAVLFVAQALVGGMLMSVGSGEAAHRLASTRVGSKYDTSGTEPIFARSNLTGWPESLTRHCTVAWSFLEHLIDSWPWLQVAFGSVAKCRAGVCGYYLLMTFLNFVRVAKDGRLEQGDLRFPLTVPLMFTRWDAAVCREGYRLFLHDKHLLKNVLTTNGIMTSERFNSLWQLWMQESGKWVSSVFRFWADVQFPHSQLPEDLGQSGNELLL